MSNYITYPELNNIGALIIFLNEYKDMDTWSIGVSVKVYDQNGESLGTIIMIDGEYALYPEADE